jgi:hypothetical protein
VTIEEITFEAFKQGREQGREESAAEIERLREHIKTLNAIIATHIGDEARAALQPKEDEQ